MFVNQVLFCYIIKTFPVFLFHFLEFWNVVHYITKNSRIVHEKVKFWAAKATKIIKILDLLKMLTSANFFVEF